MSTTAEVVKARKNKFEEIFAKASDAENLVVELVKKGETVTMLLAKEMDMDQEEGAARQCKEEIEQAARDFKKMHSTLVSLVTDLNSEYEMLRAEETNETVIVPNANVQVQSLIVTLHKFLAIDNSLIQLKKITDSILTK